MKGRPSIKLLLSGIWIRSPDSVLSRRLIWILECLRPDIDFGPTDHMPLFRDEKYCHLVPDTMHGPVTIAVTLVQVPCWSVQLTTQGQLVIHATCWSIILARVHPAQYVASQRATTLSCDVKGGGRLMCSQIKETSLLEGISKRGCICHAGSTPFLDRTRIVI